MILSKQKLYLLMLNRKKNRSILDFILCGLMMYVVLMCRVCEAREPDLVGFSSLMISIFDSKADGRLKSELAKEFSMRPDSVSYRRLSVVSVSAMDSVCRPFLIVIVQDYGQCNFGGCTVAVKCGERIHLFGQKMNEIQIPYWNVEHQMFDRCHSVQSVTLRSGSKVFSMLALRHEFRKVYGYRAVFDCGNYSAF